MRLGIALRCQIPQWPLLLLLPTSLSRLLLPSVILHLSPLSPSALRDEPLALGVLTGLSHSDATRGKLMCPGFCRSITACDGTSASALNRLHRSTWCEEEIKKKEQEGSSKNSWSIIATALMSLCHSTVVKAKVLRGQVVPLLIAAVSPDCHKSAPGDTKGTRQSPNPKHATAWAFQPGQSRGKSPAK